MSQSADQQESDLGAENEAGDASANVQDAAMESESEDEGIQSVRKRSKKMIIDDDEDDDNAEDTVDGNLDGGHDAAAVEEDGREEASDDEPPDCDEAARSPEPKKKRRIKNKLTVDEVLTEVLRDSDNEGDQTGKSDVEGPGDRDSSDEESQGPMKFNGDLFDVEDSSDEDNDLDRAAGPEYDSAEDKDFEESAIDPKLLKKLKKMKGAAKKPREQKSRKCKPTKDDLFALHSESQRLIRETHVSIPYHKPTPKSLKDFLARAQKKQEAYKDLKKGRVLDIEKARIIQEKIAGPSIEKLPSLHHKRHSSHRSGKHSAVTDSQQSLPDSGIVSSGVEADESQHVNSVHKDIPQASNAAACPLGEDELPDIVGGESGGLSLSQNTLKGSQIDNHSQSQRRSVSTLEGKDSQDVSDGDDAVVEQFDSPPVAEESQQIEEAESLSVKEGDSQSSESVTNVVPESLESNICDETAMESEAATAASTDKGEQSVTAKNTAGVSSTKKQLCGDDSGIENDFSKQLNASSPVKAVSQKKASAGGKDATAAEQAPKDSQVNSLKAARQKLLQELSEKGGMPAIGKGGGDFIVLDEGPKGEQKMQSNIDRLLQRLMHHYPKKEPKKPQDVEISIVEQTGEDGQKKELKLKTVKYRTDGKPDLDLASIAHVSGNRLQALKEKLEVGMQKQRMAAYDRRQQLYKMENEEGFEEKGEEDGLPVDEEEAEMTDRSDTEDEEEADLEEDQEQAEDDGRDWDNPFLDDEAEDDDDDDYDDGPRQRPVCAEINDMREDDVDLFQDSDKLQLRLDQSDEEEEEEDEDENGDMEKSADENEEDETDGPVSKSQSRSQRLMISDDEDDDDGSQLQPAQDPTKTCDPKLIAGNTVKDGLNESFDALTPMTRLMQGIQSGSSIPSTQSVEDSQDIFGSSGEPSQTSFEDNMSQILDADGYFRVPSSHPRKSVKPSLVMEGSQDAGDNMDMLVGLCSGQFVEGSQGGGIPASGGFEGPSSSGGGGFEGLFDNSSQSQSDQGSLTSLFDSSSQSQHAILKDSQSEGDSTSQSHIFRKPFGLSDTEPMDDEPGDVLRKRQPASGSSLGISQSGQEDMDEVLGLCSGTFPPSNSQTSHEQSQGQGKKSRGVKRRLIVQNDSSDEEEEGGTGSFLILSDNDDEEATKGSDKNELSGSDEEDHNSDAEEEPSFQGFKNKGKILRQFVEDEAELSGSEEESDENLDLDEEDDYMEVEAGDTEVLNEEQLRDQVGRVHMKQLLDDDDRQLMRYKEMYLPDGDLYSEAGGRQRRFHWKHLGDEESQNDLFPSHSDEEKEKEEMENADEKQWRMERYEREKFLESQQEDVGENVDEEGSQFMKFGQFFMKRQVSEPSALPQPPTLAQPKPKLARSQSVVDRTSPGKFLKPKIPKRGSFLGRSKENLAKIAEITKASGLNINGTRGSRSFVFSVNSTVKGADKGEESGKEQLLSKAAASAPATKKVTLHKPPAKKQCIEPVSKSKKQKSIFKLLDK